jgi:hypothetical protein
MTYNFLYSIHLADPGHETQPFCNAAQRIGRIFTVPSLGSIEDESASIMALTAGHMDHDVKSDIGRVGGSVAIKDLGSKCLFRSRDQHENHIYKSPKTVLCKRCLTKPILTKSFSHG